MKSETLETKSNTSPPRHAMLGEPNTEQFEVVTEVDGETVHRLKIHDPFVRTTTTVKGFKAAWKCLFGLSVTTRVNGSNGAMSAVMMLDPIKLSGDSRCLSRSDPSNTVKTSILK